MNGTRFDTRAVPVRQKPGAPRIQRPNPNPTDLYVFQEISTPGDNYKPNLVGSPHPTFPDVYLVKDEPLSYDGRETSRRQIYASTQNAQEVYNGVQQYLEEHADYPVIIRSFIIRQADYVPKARESACDAVVGLVLTDPGAGYGPEGDAELAGCNGTWALRYNSIDSSPITGADLSAANIQTALRAGPWPSAVVTKDAGKRSSYTIDTGDSLGPFGEPDLAPSSTLTPASARMDVTSIRPASEDSGISQIWQIQLLCLPVTFTGGGGTGATAEYRSLPKTGNENVGVMALALTHGGSGYTSAPTVTIASATGAGATATALIQPTTCLLVSEKQEGLQDPTLSPVFIRVVQVYKTLPGPVLTTKRYSETGEVITETKQERFASDSSQEPLSLNILDSRIEPIDAVTSNVITETRDAPAVLHARQLDDQLAFGAKTTTTTTDVLADGEHDVLPAIDKNTPDAKIVPINEARSKIETTTLDEGQPILYQWEQDPRTDVPILIRKQIVNGPGTASPETPTSYGTAKPVTSATAANPSVLTSNGHGYSNGDIVFAQLEDAVPAIPGNFYTVANVTTNTFTLGFALSTAATGGSVARADTGTYLKAKYDLIQAGTITNSDQLEYDPHNKWLTITVGAKVPALDGANWIRQYRGSIHHSFPNVLNGGQFNWAYAANGNASRIDYAVGLQTDITIGYSGPCDAVFTEILTKDPMGLTLPTLKRWHPKSYDITAGWAIAGSGDGQATASVVTFRIPEVVFDGDLTISYAGTGGSGVTPLGDVTLTATDGDVPTAGVYYVVDITTEKWRFGKYLVRIAKAAFPT